MHALLFLLCFLSSYCLGQQLSLFKVGFYNVENLFDAQDHPEFWDDDYTPSGKKRWTETHVAQKISQIATVIEAMHSSDGGPLIFVGLCEVENRQLLERLCQHPKLEKLNFQVVHYESKDLRGIDIGVLYRPQYFQIEYTKKYALKLIDAKKQIPYYSRDQLWVGGYFMGEYWHIGINHWPSRRGGEKRSRALRSKAAWLQKSIIDSIQNSSPDNRVLIMGDFNDNPSDLSLQLLSSSEDSDPYAPPLINPMEVFESPNRGSLAYRDEWFLFDQFLYSRHFLRSNGGSFWYRASVYHPPWLVTPQGRYKGYPYRTALSGKRLNGYSDHFPILLLGAIPHQSNSTKSSGYKK